MITALYLWVIVAAGNGGPYISQFTYSDWKYSGEYASPADCNNAVRLLGVKESVARCVPTGKR